MTVVGEEFLELKIDWHQGLGDRSSLQVRCSYPPWEPLR